MGKRIEAIIAQQSTDQPQPFCEHFEDSHKPHWGISNQNRITTFSHDLHSDLHLLTALIPTKPGPCCQMLEGSKQSEL